ncbi:hypothetical protein HYC85_018731 [Camellia sinensis]|uniref:EXPERA domain-containing protein n=1 Tax=Camellia sinensis TaxID=4442 RepID=A0A7J7GYT3_CAMSI|nr:hypothetical protein HYC85_018731 [Camellia sinensis]
MTVAFLKKCKAHARSKTWIKYLDPLISPRGKPNCKYGVVELTVRKHDQRSWRDDSTVRSSFRRLSLININSREGPRKEPRNSDPETRKEYSKGHSRYAARDSGVVVIEGITAAIATRKSYSYILQVVISLGQLYGTVVHYITSYLEGDNFAVSLYYYYVYFMIANASGVVIPTLIVIRCWKKICAAFLVQDKTKTKIL